MQIIQKYFPDLSAKQQKQFSELQYLYANWNAQINVISRKDISSLYKKHLLHSLAIGKVIQFEKGTKILDLGTGAGLPGVLLSIVGYQKVLMVDSVKKKTDFVRKIIKELSLTAKIQNKRIEKPPTSQHDIIVSRALAPLVKLLTYARMYSNKNTTSLFLKGRNAISEIDIAAKVYFFEYKKIKSLSSYDGCILKVNNIKNKNG